MQLVLSNNRIIAHGEGFLAMGGVVINTETGAKYDNATIAECEGCPSDINEVGYEYHAGEFVPCAPYGKTDKGNVLLACKECATPKRSDITTSDLVLLKNYPITATADGLNGFTAMIFDGNKYIATSSGGTVQYSYDGLTWTIAQDIGTGTTASPVIVYGNGRYIIYPTSTSANVYYSDDGITWTSAGTLTNGEGRCATYGNGKFVCLYLDSANNCYKVAHSTDGITWTTISQTFSTVYGNNGSSITYGNGKFVAWAGIYLYHSDDGITWTQSTAITGGGSTSGKMITYPKLAYGNGKFVFAFHQGSEAFSRVYYSDNGGAWNYATPIGSTTAITGITYGNGKFMISTTNGNYVYSADGITWQTGNIANVAYVYPVAGADKFIERFTLHFSTDAKYWTKGGAQFVTGDGQIIMPADLSVIYDEAAAAYAEGVNS